MIYSSSIIKKGKLRRSEYNNLIFDDIKIIGYDALSSAFDRCTSITGSVSFPELTSIDQLGLASAFFGCTGITGSVSFPKLTSIGSSGLSDAFKGCTGITEIHFRAAVQSTVEDSSTYNSKFGASNATIYFDLGVAFVNIISNVPDSTIYFKGKPASNPLYMGPEVENVYYIYKDGYCLYIGSKTPLASDEGKTLTENVTLTTLGNTTTFNVTIPEHSVCETTDISIDYIVDGIKFKTDIISGVSTNTTQTFTSIIVPAGTTLTYTIQAIGYKSITDTLTPSNNTVNISLQPVVGRIIDFSYPFTDNSSYLTNLVDNNNFVILDNTGTPASCIASGPKSYNVNNGFSTGYIQFTTPDTDDTDFLTLSVTCTNRGESTYDYGVVFINTTGTMPTSNVELTTAAGSVDTTYGEVLFQGRSNHSSTFRTVTKVLTKNTTYYLCFYYRKDRSANYGWDRLAIQNIKIPVAI